MNAVMRKVSGAYPLLIPSGYRKAGQCPAFLYLRHANGFIIIRRNAGIPHSSLFIRTGTAVFLGVVPRCFRRRNGTRRGALPGLRCTGLSFLLFTLLVHTLEFDVGESAGGKRRNVSRTFLSLQPLLLPFFTRTAGFPIGSRPAFFRTGLPLS